MSAEIVNLPGDDQHPFAIEAATTDCANAATLVAMAGGDIRFVPAWNSWIVWDGQRWDRDVRGRLHHLARQVANGLFDAAAAAANDRERRLLAKAAVAAASRRGVDSMVTLAATEHDVPLEPKALDVDPWLLNVANGTIDLRAGELRPHRRGDFLTKLVPISYDPEATCPRWLQFLAETLPAPDVRGFLQQAVGYALSGSTREQVMFILHGSGSNGKSVLLETLLDLAGDYALRTPSETLLAKRGDSIPNDLAQLRGARLVVASETEDGRRLAESRVKELVAGDTVSARFMRAEWFAFRPVAKLFLATNHRPQIRGTDLAIWRRLRLVPFEQTFGQPGSPPADPDLRDKLRAELPGILAWAVTGAVLWHRQGLDQPAAVVAATAQYRSEQDVLAEFLAEATEDDLHAWATAAEIFEAYRRWCDATGERAMSKRGLGLALKERGYQQVKTREARRWHGLKVRTP